MAHEYEIEIRLKRLERRDSTGRIARYRVVETLSPLRWTDGDEGYGDPHDLFLHCHALVAAGIEDWEVIDDEDGGEGERLWELMNDR